jgi:hypothetical protein
LYQSANSIEPVIPVRSNGSRRTLVKIGQSTLTVLPSQPPGGGCRYGRQGDANELNF